jgi:hypothetical protein
LVQTTLTAELLCRHCGKPARDGRALAWSRNWEVAHRSCHDEREIDRLLAAAHRAVGSPDAMADPAEVTLHGAIE